MSTPEEMVPLLADAEAFVGEHLGEAALLLVADGAGELVSARARAHGESCPRCAAQIGEHALAASELHAVFAAMAPAERERLRAPERAPADRSALVLRHVVTRGRFDRPSAANEEVEQTSAASAASAPTPSSAPSRRARGGALWVAGGLVVAGLASAPSVSGIARGLTDARDALLVVLAVGVQLAESVRVDPGRLGAMQTTASWTATVAMILAGVWIARRDSQGRPTVTERAAAKEAR